MLRAALLITAKDLRQRLRDRSAILFAVVVPFGLAAVLGLVIGDVTDEGANLSFVVADADGGPVARSFVDGVLGTLADAGIGVDEVAAPAEARAAVESGEADAGFVLPEGLSATVQAGARGSIEVLGNVDAQLATQVASALAETFALRVESSQLAVATVASFGGLTPEEAGEIAAAAGALPDPITLGAVTAADEELDFSTYFSAGMAVFFLFFTVQFGVTSLLEERREGTLARLLSAPIPRVAVYVGKGLTSLLLGVLSMVVLIVGTTFLLDAEWGNPLGVAVLVVAGVVSAVGLTTLIARIARTPDQANAYQSVVAVVLGMLGGSFFPVAQGSRLLAQLSKLTPHAWFLGGLGTLAGGGGAADVLPEAAAMLVFAAVAFALAAVRVRRRAGVPVTPPGVAVET